MKSKIKVVTVCALAAALVGGSAWAEGQQSTKQSAEKPNSEAKSSAASSQQNGQWQKAQTEEFFRASKLIGKSAQTSDGQKVGSIKDLAINQRGEVFALVDQGNSRWAAVPFQAINASSANGDQNVVLNTTQQALKTAPAVSQDQWGALNNPQFAQGVYSYYHLQSPTMMGGAEGPGGTSAGQGSSQDQQQPQPPQPQQQKAPGQQ